MRFVFDTNVYLSGILFNGVARKAIEYLIEGKANIYISKNIIEEIEKVLLSPKFNVGIEKAQFIIKEIESIAYTIEPKNEIRNICRDNKDHIILECAIESMSEYIVTGDKDLLVIKDYEGIKIITIKEFIELFI
jgi:putative PIN family toxin of toxin-antitoxin system